MKSDEIEEMHEMEDDQADDDQPLRKKVFRFPVPSWIKSNHCPAVRSATAGS